MKEFFGDLWRTFFPSTMELAGSMRKGFVKEFGSSYGEMIMEYFTEFGNRLKRCIAERSLAPMWGSTWDPVAWCDEVRMVMRYYPLLTTNPDSDPTWRE